MTPIVDKLSFYPFSYHPLPKIGMYEIIRYNSVKHKWVRLEKRYGIKPEIEDYVHELNEGAGIITEVFIVGYKE